MSEVDAKIKEAFEKHSETNLFTSSAIEPKIKLTYEQNVLRLLNSLEESLPNDRPLQKAFLEEELQMTE